MQERSELKISVARMRKTRSGMSERGDERLRRRQRVEGRRARSNEERRGFGGSRFLLEAHLEKATQPCTGNKKGGKTPESRVRGERGRERTGPMSGPVASDSSPRFPSSPLYRAFEQLSRTIELRSLLEFNTVPSFLYLSHSNHNLPI